MGSRWAAVTSWLSCAPLSWVTHRPHVGPAVLDQNGGMARRKGRANLAELVVGGALLWLVAWAFLVSQWKWSNDFAFVLCAIGWVIPVLSRVAPARNKGNAAQGGKARAPAQRYLTPRANYVHSYGLVREPIPARLRHEVMERDGYRCVYCGLGPPDGVKLHIDHRIPQSRGGRTTMVNLATACEQCNLGKSNLLRPSDIAGALGRDPTAEELATIMRGR